MIILLVAAAIAIVSVAAALWRSSESGNGQESPAAKDWRMVGWAYAEAGDAQASAGAYRRATEIEPENPENWSSLGEALQVASTNEIPEAASAFETALKLDPTDPRARYFLAVQKDLRGEHKAAIDEWLALLRDTPPGAPWRPDLQRTISQSAAKYKIVVPDLTAAAAPVATAAIPGPTPQQLAAAASITPSQQDEMARAPASPAVRATPMAGSGSCARVWCSKIRRERKWR
jgi:cytochrome c-type biogenesis protein CcmH